MTTSQSNGPAPIPRVDPSAWESQEGFRETLLLHFTEPHANTTLRDLGGLFFDMALECAGSWPDRPEGPTRAELWAAVADLRHLEGFLAAVGREHLLSSLDFEATSLSQFAARQAGEVERIADRIEAELEEWKGSAK
jgi:hypothetical protein